MRCTTVVRTAARGGWLLSAALATPNPLLPGDSSSPVPRMTVNLHEQSSNISRPVNYGAQPSVQSRNACSSSSQRLYLFPVVNCDLCVYVKKTRTLLSALFSARRSGGICPHAFSQSSAQGGGSAVPGESVMGLVAKP